MAIFLLALEAGMELAVLGRCLPQLTTVSAVLVWPSMPELEVPGVKAGGGCQFKLDQCRDPRSRH